MQERLLGPSAAGPVLARAARRAAACVALVLLASGCGDGGGGTWALSPASTAALQSAARPFEPDGLVAPGWTWTSLRVDRRTAQFGLVGPDGTAAVGVFHVSDPAGGDDGLVSGATRLVVEAESAAGRAAASALAARVQAAADQGALADAWVPIATANPAPDLVSDPTVRLALQALWLALLVLAGREALRLARAGRASRRVLGAAAALGLGAALPRALLATWGPGDLWFNLHGAFTEDGLDAPYGMAPTALLRLVFLLAPARFETVVVVNLLLGTVAVLLTAGLAWELRRDRLFAAAAGGLAAVQPLLVRHSGEGNRQAMLLVLVLLSLAALARFFRTRRPSLLGVSVLAAVLALQTRPEAVLLLPMYGLLCLVRGTARDATGARPLRPLALALAGGLLAAGSLALSPSRVAGAGPTPESLLTGLELLVPGARGAVWSDPDYASPAAVVLAWIGLAAALLRRERGVLWAFACLAGVTLATGGFAALVWPTITTARYHMLSVPFACSGAAFGVAAVAELLRERAGRSAGAAWVGAAALAVALLSVTPLRNLTSRRTVDHEWAFILETAPRVARGRVVYTPDQPADVGMKRLDRIVPAVLGGDADWRAWFGEPPAPGSGALYYHGAACSNAGVRAETRAVCEEGWRRYSAAPVAVTTIPGASMGESPYAAATLPIGFYAMDGQAGAVGAGGSAPGSARPGGPPPEGPPPGGAATAARR